MVLILIPKSRQKILLPVMCLWCMIVESINECLAIEARNVIVVPLLIMVDEVIVAIPSVTTKVAIVYFSVDPPSALSPLTSSQIRNE